MQMHTAHCRRMAVQRVRALSRIGVPDFQCAIGAARYDDIAGHLRRPNTPSVTDQRTKALTGDGAPHFQRIIIGARHNAIAAELQACDDVVVVPLQIFGCAYVARPPIHLDYVLSQVSRLPR